MLQNVSNCEQWVCLGTKNFLENINIIYIIKVIVQAKKSLSNREFVIWKERGRG